MTHEDQFLLLACDGLFDVFSYEDIVTFVKKQMEDHGDAQKCCEVCLCGINVY
jgi:protein phosphatase 2C family protein 2/3